MLSSSSRIWSQIKLFLRKGSSTGALFMIFQSFDSSKTNLSRAHFFCVPCVVQSTHQEHMTWLGQTEDSSDMIITAQRSMREMSAQDYQFIDTNLCSRFS